MGEVWVPDPTATFAKRLGTAGGGENSARTGGCPDIWELDNGDIAVIGRDLTESYRSRLPEDVTVVANERLVILPRAVLTSAKADIPDA